MRKIVLVIFLMIFFVLTGCTKDQTVQVTFETNGGSEISDIQAIDDLLTGIPQTSKNGYTFEGWYEDLALTDAFDPLEERDDWEFTLYAKWIPNDKEYTIEHYKESLEGTYELFEDEDLTGVTDQVVTATPKSYEGFTLDTAHTNAVPTLQLPALGDAILKLYYERNSYQVIIDEAGGLATDDLSFKYGQTITLPTITRYGYTFLSWSNYPQTMPANNLTVTASWQELPQYEVTFDERGGSEVTDQTIYQGYLVSEPDTPNRIGYEFSGWFIDLEGMAFTFTTPVLEDLVLMAKWTPIEVDYNIEFYIEELNGTYTLHHKTTRQALTDSTILATEEVILGFSENSEHVDSMPSGTVLGDGSLVLKLYYERNTYSIQFESNANLSIQSISARYEAAITKPQDPIRSGYTFEGWYQDEELTQIYTFTTMPLDGATLYAKWLGQPTNLFFNSNGGSDVLMITAPLGSSIEKPLDPTKEGHTFDGWYQDTSLTEPYTSWVMPSGGVTLHAKWQVNMYTISFEVNQGTVVPDITQVYGSSVSAPVPPTKTDYIFLGWYEDIELQSAYTFTTMPANDVTLYAKWISEEEGLALSQVLHMDDYTTVHVKGMVLMASEDPYIGFYLADQTDVVYVHYDQDLVIVGNSYEFDAIIVTKEGIPALYYVSNVLDITNTYSAPTPEIQTVDELKLLGITERKLVDVTGILLQSNYGYLLSSTIDGQTIRVTNQFSLGDTTSLIQNKVNIKGILHQYDDEWIIAVYEIQTIGITDLEKAELVRNYIDRHYLDTYVGQDPFNYLTKDPWDFGNIDMVIDTEDEMFFDEETQTFISVTTTKIIHFTITITINSTSYAHELNISLVPRTYDTVYDVINATLGETYNLQGLIVMASFDEDVYILKDSTGEIFILGDLNVNYGDQIAIEVTTKAMSHLIYGQYENEFFEVVSSNHELDNLPQVMELADIEQLTYTDATQYGNYLEIKGFLRGPSEMDMHDQFVLHNETYQLMISPASYSGYEVLFGYDGLEVCIRGYLALNEDGLPILVFTGQRREIFIPDYTDDERVEMILTLFSNQYADYQFKSYETFVMLPYHPILGGTITWNFIEGGTYYDQNHQWFTYAGDIVPIKIEMTITYGIASRTYIFQTTLDATHALTIEQFKNLTWYEEGFVEGVVVYRCPELMYIQDETGLLMIDVYDVDAYPGDRVILYGQMMSNYQYQENKYLYYYRSYDSTEPPLVVHIIERGLSYEINVETKDLSDVAHMDPMAKSSYGQYVQTDGYLTYDGWEFTLTKGEFEISFEAIDEYTMYKLASWQDTNVSIKLMVDNYNGSNWEFVYLGIDGDIAGKSYTLSDKQGILSGLIDSIWTAPILSGTQRPLPTSYEAFEATYAYSVPETYQYNFDVSSGSVYNILEPTVIPLTVTITVDSVSIDHVINVSVLPADSSDVISILEAKALLGEPVTLQLVIYASFDYEYNTYGIIAHDGTDFVIVNLSDLVYFYEGSHIGKTAIIDGVMQYEDGRYILHATSYKTIDFAGAPSLTATPMAIETFVTEDHSHDQYLGEFVELTGTINRVGWDHYEIVSGYHHIRIQTISPVESSLNDYVGFDVKIKGFILGRTTYDDCDDLSFVIGHASYDGMLYMNLNEPDDQVVAQKLVHYFIANRYDPVYREGDYIQLGSYHPLFTSAIVTYEAMTHPTLFEPRDSQYLVKHSDVDVISTIRLTVSYQTATVVYDFEVEVDGYVLNTLDDLFDETVAFDEINLEAIVITSDFDYLYVLIDGEVYYYQGHLGIYGDQGSVIVLNGKKSTIDGKVNYSYNVNYQDLQAYEEVMLLPRSLTISDLYSADFAVDDIRRDYLTVYGKLGYDAYLRLFYLDDLGQRIYIRNHLSSYEAYSNDYQILKAPSMSLEVFNQYLDDYVYVNVLFPNQKVLADYLLVDFVGSDQDIWIPNLTQTEKINITKDKVILRMDGNEYTTGEDIELMTADSVQHTWIEYSLVNPSQVGILLDTWDSKALLVDERTAVQLVATVYHYDELTEVTLSDTVTLTIYINPLELSTVREVLFGNLEQCYKTKGVIQFLYEDYYMIIKDSTGLLYVEIPNDISESLTLAVGDEVEVLGERGTWMNMDYVPVMDYAFDIKVLSTGNQVVQTPITMTIDDILNIDYLDPDAYNQYIRITGIVIFSGNTGYPSYDLRADGYTDNTYDLQLWGNTYDSFNTQMDPLVGQWIEVEGYLVGFEYIYQAFDWHLKVTQFEVLIP